jgi:hypothetical protein
VALDLTFGRNVEFILNFQLNKGRRDNEDMTQNVFLQCSPDNGLRRKIFFFTFYNQDVYKIELP